MTNLYVWLRFLHLAGLGVFLFGHGIAAGASLAQRARPASDVSRALLKLSIWSYAIAYPGLVVLIVTGVWMGFAGSWWGRGWIWAAIAVLILVFGLMTFISIPYHQARDSLKEPDSALAERLARTRPLLAAWIGTTGVLVLLFLMVFKPF
jgi:uncharacterized membrane protein